MTKIAIIAAMPGELKPLVRGWAHEQRNGAELWRWKFDQGEWVAACAGAGVDAATRAFAEIERDGAVDQVISTGWAGALSQEFAPGKVYRVSGVIDARTGERFQVAMWSDEHWLVTSPKVAGLAEKQRLAATYHAGLVDMEAAGIARLAAQRQIPFYAIKGISDGFHDKLPDFNRFITPQGRFQLLRFILFAAVRPIYWPALIQMGENSRKASQSIREAVLNFLDERGHIRQRNGYPNFRH